MAWNRFWQRKRRDSEVAQELESYLDHETGDNLAAGMDIGEARCAARRKLGSPSEIREAIYEMNSIITFDVLLKDVRQGLRMLKLSPGVSILAVISLALGIGANTALFSVVNAVLLKPLPYREPHRLARIWMDNRRLQLKEDWSSWLNYQDWKQQGTCFEQMAAFVNQAVNLIGDGEPERVRGVAAEATVFEVLGINAAHGRLFTRDEEIDGKNAVIVIGWSLWQRRFGGQDVRGKMLDLDGRRVVVVGVMPQGFAFPDKETEYWIPLVVNERAKVRVGYWLQIVGRMKPGVTPEQAQAEMTTVGKRLEQQYPAENAGYGVYVNPLLNHEVGSTRTPLLMLMGAVGFVLLIACVNVAGLFLARGEGREREMALRSALGARRIRLLMQLLSEAVVIALMAGAAGILVALAGVRALVAAAPPDMPRLDRIGMNAGVLAFAFVVTLLTAVLFGLLPAWRVSRVDLNRALRESGRSIAGTIAGRRTRAALVVAECALAIVLLAGAGLLIRSLAALRGIDPGFRTDRVLSMRVNTSRSKLPEAKQVGQFYDQLLERVRGLPGVEGAASATTIFLSSTPNSGIFTLEDRPPFPPSEQIEATIDIVSPRFFETLGIRLIHGRFFDASDGAESPRVMIVNETFANRYWPGQNPVGKKFKWGRPDPQRPWITIVGVAGDMRRQGMHRPARLETFLPLAQAPGRGMVLVVTARREPLALVSAVRADIRALDPAATVTDVSTLEAEIGQSLAARRFQSLLLALFSVLALLLASIGIFGLMYQAVQRRTHEIGVRLAIGAQPDDVLRMILRDGMSLAGLGIALGIAGALALTRLVGGLLYGVKPWDPMSYLIAAALLCAATLVACWLPARRAVGIDPVSVLRYE